MKHKVRWDELARNQLKEAYAYIKRDSLSNAENVKIKILGMTKDIPVHPYKHPADKFKIDNDGNYRSFTVHRYRVSYKITASEIIIIRMRHTSMEPLEY
jgi:plasmid stabilization system protein ParE